MSNHYAIWFPLFEFSIILFIACIQYDCKTWTKFMFNINLISFVYVVLCKFYCCLQKYNIKINFSFHGIIKKEKRKKNCMKWIIFLNLSFACTSELQISWNNIDLLEIIFELISWSYPILNYIWTSISS